MARQRFLSAGLARLLLELVLASFTIWLVVQNALLLFLNPWKEPPVALAVAATLVRVSLALIETLWPWMAVSLLVAGALAIGLVHGSTLPEEVRHG